MARGSLTSLFRRALAITVAPAMVSSCGAVVSDAVVAESPPGEDGPDSAGNGGCPLCTVASPEAAAADVATDTTAPGDTGSAIVDAGAAAVDAPLVVDAGLCTAAVNCAGSSSVKTVSMPCPSGPVDAGCDPFCKAAGYFGICMFNPGGFDGGPFVTCCYNAGGRRPGGVSVEAARAANPLGAFFAGLAELEAVSVPAFERLRAELVAHAAPSSLVARAEAAIEDERAHTTMTTALAERFGGAPRPPEVPPLPVRPLRHVAVENAAEGCVRETFGALVAIHQAACAEDPDVKRAMRRIARDERRHAQLAWDVASFCDDRLDETERSAVRAAVRGALDDLRAAVDRRPHGDVVRLAGMPSREVAGRLLACLEDAFTERTGAFG